MPSYWNDDFDDVNTQDWEPVILKRPKNKEVPKNNSLTNELPLHRKIALARSRNEYTQHEFAQLIHMKVKDYIKLENGIIDPSPQVMVKIRKYLDIKIYDQSKFIGEDNGKES